MVSVANYDESLPTALTPETARKVADALREDPKVFEEWRNVEKARRAGLDYLKAAKEQSALVKLAEQVPVLIEEFRAERAELKVQADARVSAAAMTWPQAMKDAWTAALGFPVSLVEAIGDGGAKLGMVPSAGLVMAVMVLSVGVSASAVGGRRLELTPSGLVLFTPPNDAVVDAVRNAHHVDVDEDTTPRDDDLDARIESDGTDI